MNHLLKHRARLVLSLQFPTGICPGQGKLGNAIEPLEAADSTANKPRLLLRGTTMAGVLRHAIARTDASLAEEIFGTPCNDRVGKRGGGVPSRVAIGDAVIDAAMTSVRTHNRIAPKRGATDKGALFSLVACAPGAETTLVSWLEGADGDSITRWAKALIAAFDGTLTVGASSARGIGRVELKSHSYRIYRCDDANGLGDFLHDHRTWRAKPDAGFAAYEGGTRLNVATPLSAFTVTCTLTVSRGQDILVAADHMQEPQYVLHADGRHRWRIPGSTIRGLFRDWCRRKLARTPSVMRPPGDAQWDAIQSLFGDVETEACGDGPPPRQQAGRVLIPDSFAECRNSDHPLEGDDKQERTHVAIDRVSGGAIDALLYKNDVILSGTTYHLCIGIRDYKPHEAAWIGGFLNAVNVGIVRIGSSKAAGRVDIGRVKVVGDEDSRKSFCTNWRGDAQ